MKLELKLLYPNSKEMSYFAGLNDEAFPPFERMSFNEIFDFASDTDTDVLGIYDAETPVGFAVLLKNSECGYVYFIAIDQLMRSKGYGSAALRKLIELYPGRQLILDFEAVNENAENNSQRVRRKNFYLRNGFHETGNFTMLHEERFEVVCTGCELRKTAFKNLLYVIHQHRPEFPNVLL